MPIAFRPARIAIVLLACLMPLFALAQTPEGSSESTRPHTDSDRLFLSFIEDADLVDKQWWEGSLVISDGAYDGEVDSNVIGGVAAFQPWKRVEMGGRMGFGNTDTKTIDDGSGATDLDVWAKWHLGSDANDTNFAVGGIVTVPTGDDSVGLGTDAFAIEGFGSLRYTLPKWTLVAQAGLRFNEDGQIGGSELDGETSSVFGVGVLVPLNKKFTFVGETRFESERFDNLDNDFRLLGGVNWHGLGRGMFRGALSFGLADAAPSFQIIAGYAAEF